MGQIVALDGMHLDMEKVIPWGFSSGVAPFQAVIETDANEAAHFLDPSKMGKPLTMRWADAGGREHTWNGIYVLGEAPTQLPDQRGFVISDVRWLLSKVLVVGFYNKLRRTGRSHLASEGEMVPIELAEREHEYIFAPFSLDSGERFTARRVLEDVAEKIKARLDVQFIIPDQVPEEVPIFDLDIVMNGHMAIDEVLKSLPGLDIYADGQNLVFYNALDRTEIESVRNAGQQDYGKGWVPARDFDFSATRPSKFVFYIIREHEFRVNNRQEGTEVVEGNESLEMENVTVVSDPSLETTKGKLGNGTIIDFDTYIAAINSDTGNFPDGAPALSHTVIQESFFESELLQTYVNLMGAETPDALWMGRTSSILRDYRQFYQINRRVMDRFHRIRPVRAAMIDPVRGTRGKALAWTDYCKRYNVRYKNPDENQQLLFGNVEGYNALLKNGKVAPAEVSVVDDEVGLIRLDYRTDYEGKHASIYPSKMANIPTADLSNDGLPSVLNEETEEGVSPKLASDHRAAVVLTGIPAAPNSKRQFYSVEITPDQAAPLIPGGEIGASTGPPQDIFIRPGIITARFAWSDDDGDSIRRVLGILDPPENLGPEARAELEQEDQNKLDELLTNKEDLEEFAKAAAAVEYARLLDRPLGNFTTRFNPSARIRGAVKSILHGLNSDGEMTTTYTLADELRQLDAMGLIPDALRRELRREPIQ